MIFCISRILANPSIFICRVLANTYDQAASNLVSGNSNEQVVQQLMDMGGGNWDKDKVLRALRAAYNNPERAVEYLYSVGVSISRHAMM